LITIHFSWMSTLVEKNNPVADPFETLPAATGGVSF
jgi:hypothetical protein